MNNILLNLVLRYPNELAVWLTDRIVWGLLDGMDPAQARIIILDIAGYGDGTSEASVAFEAMLRGEIYSMSISLMSNPAEVVIVVQAIGARCLLLIDEKIAALP